MEREAVVWNFSCVDALKGTVLHRTVPRDRVNGKPIRTVRKTLLIFPQDDRFYYVCVLKNREFVE